MLFFYRMEKKTGPFQVEYVDSGRFEADSGKEVAEAKLHIWNTFEPQDVQHGLLTVWGEGGQFHDGEQDENPYYPQD
jgi:hypothetical protein